MSTVAVTADRRLKRNARPGQRTRRSSAKRWLLWGAGVAGLCVVVVGLALAARAVVRAETFRVTSVVIAGQSHVSEQQRQELVGIVRTESEMEQALEIIAKLNASIDKFVKSADGTARLRKLGADPVGGSPDDSTGIFQCAPQADGGGASAGDQDEMRLAVNNQPVGSQSKQGEYNPGDRAVHGQEGSTCDCGSISSQEGLGVQEGTQNIASCLQPAGVS